MPLRRQFEAVLRQRAAKAGDARAGAVVVALERRDDPDAAMAELDDMRRRAMGGGFIVGADARVGPVGLVDADIDEGYGVVGEQLAQAVVMAVAAQHEAVDTAADQIARLLQFDVEIVAARGEKQHVSDRRQIFLQRGDAAREHRVVDRRNDRAQRARAPRRQDACRRMRDVAERVDGLRDARTQGRAHGVGVVERARDRCRRNAGARRDGADALFRQIVGGWSVS